MNLGGYLLPVAAGIVCLIAGAGVAIGLAGRPFGSTWRACTRRPRDVIVPLLCAVSGAMFAVRFGASIVLVAYLYLVVVGLALAAIDAEQHRLPDRLTLPSYPIAFALLAVSVPFVSNGTTRLLHALIGMAAYAALFGLLFVIRPQGMGFGDVKLAGVLGAYLGWLGSDAWVLGVFVGVVLAGLFSLGLLALRRAGRKSRIAFGPFMVAGALLGTLLSIPAG